MGRPRPSVAETVDNLMRNALLVVLLASSAALAQGGSSSADAKTPPKPVPTDAQCPALPQPKAPFAFGAGERLEFDLDALGAEAGKMTMRVLPQKSGLLPVEIRAETNTFFSKVRKVKGSATSYLNPRSLRPTRYFEDATENDVRRTADVHFVPLSKKVQVQYVTPTGSSKKELKYGNDAFDVAGAIYMLRQLPLKAGMPICFDAYGIRRIWRVFGTVQPVEQVSSPLGVFKAWHIVGEAVRLDSHNVRREIHVWITDDERRLPLAAVGVIDLGAVRATLTSVDRPGEKQSRAQGKESLKW